MPGVFVLLWSTGFIGAKLGLPYAGPFTFLLLRMMVVTTALGGAALLLRAPWPRTWQETARIALVGLLIHGAYLGGVFIAIAQGVPAGVAALMVSLQPLATALVSGPYLGERLNRLQWLGLLLGFCGVALVVIDKLAWRSGDIAGVASSFVALVGITVGTLYQKRHSTGMNLITGSCVQFAAAGLAFLPLALIFETGTRRLDRFVRLRPALAVVRAVDRRDDAVSPAGPARRRRQGGEPLLPDAGDDGDPRLAAVRRDPVAGGDRGIGGCDPRRGPGGAKLRAHELAFGKRPAGATRHGRLGVRLRLADVGSRLRVRRVATRLAARLPPLAVHPVDPQSRHVERPGLALGLERGGSCRGFAFRIAAPESLAAARSSCGIARWPWRLPAEDAAASACEGGVRVPALVFVARPDHPQYVGDLAPEKAAALVAQGSGEYGTAIDYLRNVVRHLDEFGIADCPLHRVLSWRKRLAVESEGAERMTGSTRAAVHTGGCQCGAVRYALYAPPEGTHVCHCRMCQKAVGGPFAALAPVRLADFAWTRGTPGSFLSSPLAARDFCAACGTPLTFRYLDSEWIDVTIGSLDRPARGAARCSSTASRAECPGSTR